MRAAEEFADADADLVARDARGQQLLAAGAQRLGDGDRGGKHHRRRMEHGAVVHVVLLGEVRGGGVRHGREIGSGALARDDHLAGTFGRPHRFREAHDALDRAGALAGDGGCQPVDQQVLGLAHDRVRDLVEAQAGGEAGELGGGGHAVSSGRQPQFAQDGIGVLTHCRHRIHAVVEAAWRAGGSSADLAGRRAHCAPAVARLQLRMGPQPGHVVHARVGDLRLVQALLHRRGVELAEDRMDDGVQLGAVGIALGVGIEARVGGERRLLQHLLAEGLPLALVLQTQDHRAVAGAERPVGIDAGVDAPVRGGGAARSKA